MRREWIEIIITQALRTMAEVSLQAEGVELKAHPIGLSGTDSVSLHAEGVD